MKLNLSSLLVSILLVSFSLTSCGYNEEHIKNYVFYVHSDNQLYVNTIDTLVSDFNYCVGSEVFKTTRDTTKYNSSIYLNTNLREIGESVIGYGTFIRKTSQSNPLDVLKGSYTLSYKYTGEIRLDLGFFSNNLETDDEINVNKNSDGYGELKKLFFHEAGHVVGLDHTDSEEDVMYYTISGDKDYDAFCNLVNKKLEETI